jgi:hypothetical protein
MGVNADKHFGDRKPDRLDKPRTEHSKRDGLLSFANTALPGTRVCG